MTLKTFKESLDYCQRFRYYLKESEIAVIERLKRQDFHRLTLTDQMVLEQITDRLTRELV